MQLVLKYYFFLFLCFSFSNNRNVSALNSDGVALISLQRHWTSVPPSLSSSWNISHSTPCSWVGVQCDNNSNVVSLNLSGYGIPGRLGSEIASLTHLKTIGLDSNRLSGMIPPELGNCSMLEFLNLSTNAFGGEVPETLKNLQSLKFLTFSANSLNGEIPESLFQIPNLQYLDLSFNKFSGGIPLGPGNCKKLEYMDLSYNSFNGGIPSELGHCNRLQTLVILNANLTNSIPSSFGLLNKLSYLDLCENRLSGKIPPQLGNCGSLKVLRLYLNQLEGEISSGLGSLSELEDLQLHYNHLSGEIPISIWKLENLKYISVYNNSLSGELPLDITELKQLKEVRLFNNKFFGVIPQSLGINSSLVVLDFMNNKFTGNIPPNLCFGKQLVRLILPLNQLQGSIPSNIGRCPTLQRLRLDQNNLTGSLPEFLENPNLFYMDISKNNLEGEIEKSLGSCTNLTLIKFSENKFTGLIPKELGNLVNLQTLDFSKNFLEGPLPSLLSKCTKLDSFDVGFNRLNSSIPSSLTSWTLLSTLVLRENRFTGGIPRFLSESAKLTKLELGGNMFGGEIPSSLGFLTNLRYGLNLSNNRLTGELPSELRNLAMLQQVDISHNNLTGTLTVLGEISSLVELNISYNLFKGPIPETLMKLLNSSPSLFTSNPELCIKSQTDGLTFSRNNNFKPCELLSSSHKKSRKVEKVMIAIGSSFFVVSVLLGLVFMSLRRRQKKRFEIIAQDKSSILHDKVMEATENLDERYIIGKGAHGTVYKASLNPHTVFAVKKLVFEGNNSRSRSMITEIETVGKIRHRNLIQLEDFWLGKEYGLIFYRYMPNGSLYDVLHEKNPPPILKWSVRFKVALGTAHALAYLHFDSDPAIVHRDIKPHNILLDSEMEPHITDFGIAKLLDQSSGLISSVSVAGTIGYIPPEKAFTTTKSKDSDVYSYGVVLLELITRKKALDSSFIEGMDIVGWVRSVWSNTLDMDRIVDPSLKEEIMQSDTIMEQVNDVILVALRCTEKQPKERPTMRDVVKQLLNANAPKTRKSASRVV